MCHGDGHKVFDMVCYKVIESSHSRVQNNDSLRLLITGFHQKTPQSLDFCLTVEVQYIFYLNRCSI